MADMTAKPVSVAPDDEALIQNAIDLAADPVNAELNSTDALNAAVEALRRHIAGLRYEADVWRSKAETRGREGAEARAALAACRAATIEECEAKIMARREQWKNAGGFDGHAAATKVMLNEIRALKDKETRNG